MDFEEILKSTQKELFQKICRKYSGSGYYCKDNFVLVRGQIPALLVAHLDTVHTHSVKTICRSENGDVWMSPQGIGGDDRCGVYALTSIYDAAENGKKPWLLFTCNEEIGCLGAKMFAKCYKAGKLPQDLAEMKFIIEIDRRGANDAVFYDCDNPDFEEFICSAGFIRAFGTCSDVSVIAPALGVAAVNLSSGYYNAHMQHEYIRETELVFTIHRVERLLAQIDYTEKFPYIEFVAPSLIKQGNLFSETDYYDEEDAFRPSKKKEKKEEDDDEDYDLEEDDEWWEKRWYTK